MAELVSSLAFEGAIPAQELAEGIEAVVSDCLHNPNWPDLKLIAWFLKKGAEKHKAHAWVNEKVSEWHRNASSVAEIWRAGFTKPQRTSPKYSHDVVEGLLREADATFDRGHPARPLLNLGELDGLRMLVYFFEHWNGG